MKVLHVTASMDPAQGGVCKAIRELVAVLDDRGHYNEIASLDGASVPWISVEPLLVHALGPGRGPWKYAPRLLAWLRENACRFDVVVVHGLWLYSSYAVWSVLRDTGQPSFYVMPHGMLDPYFQRLDVRPVKAVRNWIFWKLLERRVVNDAAGLLFTCEEELRLARTTFRPYRPRRENVVGLGVQAPPAFTESMREAFRRISGTAEEPFFLFLGRLHPKKGLDLLIQAYAEVAAEHRFPGFPRLLIAGPCADLSYLEKLKGLAKALLLEQNLPSVVFVEMLTGEAKWGALHGCEAFVLPSHQENFGIAVAEALACGRPVLISDKVNIWREIQADGAGFVESDTVAGTRRLLSRWIDSAESLRGQLSASATRCFQQRFASMSMGLAFEKSCFPGKYRGAL